MNLKPTIISISTARFPKPESMSGGIIALFMTARCGDYR
jgi:hypothetical protein